MKIKNVLYLPSGRVFLVDVNGYRIEMTEMRDVTVGGKGSIPTAGFKLII